MAADWISPKDQLPPEGQPVEVSILANSPDVSTGMRSGDGWWIDRTHGGPYLMSVPAAPAYWRPVRGQKIARAA